MLLQLKARAREVIQCVVDEAHYLFWETGIGSERAGQKALMARLRDKWKFHVVSETVVALQILGSLPDKKDRLINRTDLIINDTFIVELKHGSSLNDREQEQLRAYMKHPKLQKEYGLLLSFPKDMKPATLPAQVAYRGDGWEPGSKYIHFEPIAPSPEAFMQKKTICSNEFSL